MRKNIHAVVRVFTDENCKVPANVAQLILELAGLIRVSHRSVIYYRWFVPRPMSFYKKHRLHKR